MVSPRKPWLGSGKKGCEAACRQGIISLANYVVQEYESTERNVEQHFIYFDCQLSGGLY